MKISIITVCYNSASTISDTIASVARQNYGDIEHIIVDGGSTDGTVDIVKSSSSVSKYISELDRGIYDAMNKGINLATGDVIGTLNSDDFYVDENVLSKVANAFESRQDVEAIYADLVYVEQVDTNKVVRFWKSQDFYLGMFRNGWVPAHPTFFVRKEVYQKLGTFDLKYKIAADFELLYRFLEEKKVSVYYLPELLVKMRVGGTTNNSFANILEQNREILSVMKARDKQFSSINWMLRKVFNRVLQFIRRP